ncbi:MAG: DUF4271 domain-containing protein [Prevotella sp.]|nr:DUF4271 domain-containing protein [Prevotella sp.]
MTLQSDTIIQNTLAATDTAQQVRPHKLTPADVAKWMPQDATPAQLDSAIQRHIKPAEIHWSEQPETLHLPGQPIGKSAYEVTLSDDFRETYYSKTQFTHAQLTADRSGVAGDPIPYTIAGDNLITSLLIACIIIALLAFQKTKRVVIQQAKHFFRTQRDDKSNISETTEEARFQFFLAFQTCLLCALIYFFYIQTDITDTFIIEQYQVIGVFTAEIGLYYILKSILYWTTHQTFFDGKKNEQWTKAVLFLISMQGITLFPIVMIQTYFGISVKTTWIYTLSVVILFKFFTLYKAHLIFFRKKADFLQIILYFCALEAVPLSLLWTCLQVTSNYLKVNF